MSRYTQDNVPEQILNRFPTLRNRPPSVARVQQNSEQTSQKQESSKINLANDNTSQNSCQDSDNILQELKKKFPELSSISNQRVIDRSQLQTSVAQIQQPLLLVSTVRSLNKEFAPETIPLKEQIVINKANCSLCPNHKKTQSGLINDLPISHQSPKKKRY